MPEPVIQSPGSELDPDFEESTEDPGVVFFCGGVGLIYQHSFSSNITVQHYKPATCKRGRGKQRTHVALSNSREYTVFSSLCNATNLS